MCACGFDLKHLRALINTERGTRKHGYGLKSACNTKSFTLCFAYTLNDLVSNTQKRAHMYAWQQQINRVSASVWVRERQASARWFSGMMTVRGPALINGMY